MPAEKVVILDGAASSDNDLSPILSVLSDVLKGNGSQVETFPLREMKLAHCLGCFKCWVETPGICVEADGGREIAKAIIQSDTTVLFTPVTFGGYSPDLKKMVDRFVQIISPYFQMDHGEVHHVPRYARLPRLVIIGVQHRPNSHEAHIFKTLAGRNAINFRPSSYAVEVVLATEDAGELRQRFQTLLARSDALPFGELAASLMPPPATAGPTLTGPDSERRALLIVGSPKTSSTSTSSVLGSYLLDRLKQQGWETETVTLRANLNREDGQREFLRSVDRARLITLVFPLYVDALPYLVTKAMAVIAAHRPPNAEPHPQRFVGIVNSGFPEARQNAVALAICREFATQCGFAWAGGLALGGGGIVGGQPLSEAQRSRPPLKHIFSALDLTGASLAQGLPVPAEAVEMMTKNPIPFMPLALWHWLYLRIGGKGFEKEAAKHGVSKHDLLARPYAA